jgi:hypothetical protein
MRRVIVESPFGGDVERNLRYLRACMADCLARGESPYASHALYTQPGVLDDTKPDERAKGIAAGFVWRRAADATVFYLDLGTSRGMELGMADALGMAAEPGCENHAIEVRRLGGEWACP